MANSSNDLAQRLAELRTAFDQTFTLPAIQPGEDSLDFALIAAGEHCFALRMSELAGVAVNRKIVPVPGNLRGLLGLSTVEGQLVPVFDLAAALGLPTTRTNPRWLALYRGAELVGLAFEKFHGLIRLHAQGVHPLEFTQQQAAYTRQAIQVDSEPVHVLEFSELARKLSETGQL